MNFSKSSLAYLATKKDGKQPNVGRTNRVPFAKSVRRTQEEHRLKIPKHMKEKI